MSAKVMANGNREVFVRNGQKNEEGHDLINNVSRVTISTGNIANWNSLKSRKVTQSPSKELYHSLLKTLTDWSNKDAQIVNDRDTVAIRRTTEQEKIDETERGLVKVAVKIFLHKLNVDYIKEAVDCALSELNIAFLDTVYLALPPLDEEKFTEVIQPFWKEMERLHEDGLTYQISTCDLDQPKLQILIENAKTTPEVNQVNLTSCCHMPEELVSYAKQVKVLLHTHGDQPIMLPNESLSELTKEVYPNCKQPWSTNWVVRYAAVVKCRGVIKSKGYIASFEVDEESGAGPS